MPCRHEHLRTFSQSACGLLAPHTMSNVLLRSTSEQRKAARAARNLSVTILLLLLIYSFFSTVKKTPDEVQASVPKCQRPGALTFNAVSGDSNALCCRQRALQVCKSRFNPGLCAEIRVKTPLGHQIYLYYCICSCMCSKFHTIKACSLIPVRGSRSCRQGRQA